MVGVEGGDQVTRMNTTIEQRTQIKVQMECAVFYAGVEKKGNKTHRFVSAVRERKASLWMDTMPFLLRSLRRTNTIYI